MTLAVNKMHFNIGLWPTILFLCSFGGCMWKSSSICTQFLNKQDSIYVAINRHSVQLDTVVNWHKGGLLHRNSIDQRVDKISKRVDTLWLAFTDPESLVTERKLKNGRVIFQKIPHTTK
jgi:hypothetical protein